MNCYEFNANMNNKCCGVATDCALNKLNYVKNIEIYPREEKVKIFSNLNKESIVEKLKTIKIYCSWCNINIKLNLNDSKSLSVKQENNNSNNVYPFINELVDSLFNNELNSIIDENTELNHDKSVFMMFVNIYFMAYLHTQSKTSTQNRVSDEERKKLLKEMLSDVIRCPEKRQVCVSLIKQINPLFNIDSVIKNTIENNENDHLLKDD